MASWIIPCNPKLYDVYGAFRTLGTVYWHQSAKNIEIGDTVYVYAGKPIQAVTHKCLVLNVCIPGEETDDSDSAFDLSPGSLSPYPRYMQLKMVKEYDPSVLPFSKFVDHGLNSSIQGQRHTGPIIQGVIDSADM